jgi:ABC-2 type transport system ATP-binding protein
MVEALVTKNLSKLYGGVRALDGANIVVAEGEVFGYLGPNGSGKTTTVRLATTLISPSSGTVTVFGYDVCEDPVRVRECIGLVQQAPSCEPYLSVLRNVSLYAYMNGLSWGEATAAAREVMDLFGLSEYADRKAVQLSIGLKRRLQIARELVKVPRMLFLDEPTIGLDPEAKRLTLDIVREKAKSGVTVFFTTHNMSEAEYICDRVAILDRGKILLTDTPSSITESTGTDNLEDGYLSVIRRSRG